MAERVCLHSGASSLSEDYPPPAIAGSSAARLFRPSCGRANDEAGNDGPSKRVFRVGIGMRRRGAGRGRSFLQRPACGNPVAARAPRAEHPAHVAEEDRLFHEDPGRDVILPDILFKEAAVRNTDERCYNSACRLCLGISRKTVREMVRSGRESFNQALITGRQACCPLESEPFFPCRIRNRIQTR